MEDLLAKRVRMGRLYMAYKNLLTDKQNRVMSLYFDEDLSLSEVAEITGVSRQAVFDQLKRVEAKLEEYEGKLGLAKL